MKRAWAIILIFSLFVLLNGCRNETEGITEINQTNITTQKINEVTTFDKFNNYLNSGQMEKYNATYEELFRVSSGQRKEQWKYNLSVVREFIDSGPAEGLTANRIRQIVKEQINSWKEETKNSVLEFQLSKKIKCFSASNEKSTFTMCFDDEQSLIYYNLFGDVQLLTWRLSPQLVWKIPLSFPFEDKTVRDQQAIQKQRLKKIDKCTDTACNEFFTIIGKSSDITGRDEFVTSGYSVSNLLQNFHESEIKKYLSDSIKPQCKFKSRHQGELNCFTIKPTDTSCSAIDTGFVEFINDEIKEYPMKECNYCFSAEGYLISTNCLSTDGQAWKWSKSK